jgi:hypothetical protein
MMLRDTQLCLAREGWRAGSGAGQETDGHANLLDVDEGGSCKRGQR